MDPSSILLWGPRVAQSMYIVCRNARIEKATKLHRWNLGRIDGHVLATYLATGPSATTFCQITFVQMFATISHHNRNLKLKDISGEG